MQQLENILKVETFSKAEGESPKGLGLHAQTVAKVAVDPIGAEDAKVETEELLPAQSTNSKHL